MEAVQLDKNQEPNYKGYSASLIHPAFQQQTTKRENRVHHYLVWICF